MVTRNRPSGEQPMLPVWSTTLWKEEIKRCRYNHLQGSEEGTYIPLQSYFRKTSLCGVSAVLPKNHKMYMIFPNKLSRSVQSGFSQTKASHPPWAGWKCWTRSWKVFPSSQHTAAPDSTWTLSRCVKILCIWHSIVLLHPKQCFIKNSSFIHVFFSRA